MWFTMEECKCNLLSMFYMLALVQPKRKLANKSYEQIKQVKARFEHNNHEINS
mgnify:CR=1 FL=1